MNNEPEKANIQVHGFRTRIISRSPVESCTICPVHVQTHIMAGWCTANLIPQLNARQRFFCMIAAAVPDIDGLSILFGQDAYWKWHHRAGHNLLVCVLACLLLAVYSRPFIWSFVLYIAQFHLHLDMDIFGSGPGWGIYYFWPFSAWMFDNTPYSWAFYSWQNLTIAGLLLAAVVGIIYWKRRTPLEVIMPRLDQQITRALITLLGKPGVVEHEIDDYAGG